MRTVPEWRSDNDDARPPRSVQIRLYEAARGMCQKCNAKLKTGNWHIDHKIRLKDGQGNNRELNLQILCTQCHKEKTAKENSDQAKANRIKAKTYGVKRKSKFRGWRKMNGEVVWND